MQETWKIIPNLIGRHEISNLGNMRIVWEEIKSKKECGATFVKDRPNKPWKSRANLNGERHHLGHFKTKQEAIDARTEFLRVN